MNSPCLSNSFTLIFLENWKQKRQKMKTFTCPAKWQNSMIIRRRGQRQPLRNTKTRLNWLSRKHSSPTHWRNINRYLVCPARAAEKTCQASSTPSTSERIPGRNKYFIVCVGKESIQRYHT